MRTASAATAMFAWFLCATAAYAAPTYSDDPFEDNDFISPPLILDVAHTTKGRGEISLLYSGSTIDKYTSHQGGMLEFNYHFVDTFGAALSFGFYHGALTNIVTSARGIIGNKMSNCLRDPTLCSQLDPNVPDYSQITGMLSLLGVWSPLYGKINVVSELDVNLQLYAMLGGGINGTRRITATPRPGAVSPIEYDLNNEGFFEGGIFDGMRGHITVGAGLRIFLFDWFNIRAEFRAMGFLDEFDFDEDGTSETVPSLFYFTQLGVGFVLF